MRRIVVVSMLSLDGVMQAPGGPEEDRSGGFSYGGWVAPYGEEGAGKVMERLMQPSDLLLGRKTFEIWEGYWPRHADSWPGINEVTKYVLSTSRKASDWQNSVFLNTITGIERLKASPGSDIRVWGSSKLIQSLLEHDLVDEIWLLIHPLILGKGKKLFKEDSMAAAYDLVETSVTAKGVIMAHYKRAGAVKTGTVGKA